MLGPSGRAFPVTLPNGDIMASPQKTGTEAHGGPHGDVGFPPFKTDTYASQLIWLAVFFGALYWLVSRIFAPRLQAVLDTRAGTIAHDLEAAQSARVRAEAAGQAYEKALAESRAKAQAIAQDTRDKVNAAAEQRREALEADLAARLAAAESQIATTRTRAMENVGEIAAEAAGLIVARLGGTKPAPAALATAIAAAVKP